MSRKLLVYRCAPDESRAELIESIPEINARGFRTDETDEVHTVLRAELVQDTADSAFVLLNGWLSSFDRSDNPRLNSYGLKHVYERETCRYLINGAFIIGCIMAGFTVRVTGVNGLIAAKRRAI
jgi:hypothetical protein